jgi:hypothetical protein
MYFATQKYTILKFSFTKLSKNYEGTEAEHNRYNTDTKYGEVFKAIDVFKALHFTATEASPAAKRTRILSMNQHA